MKNKIFNITICCLFSLFLILLFLSNIITPDRKFSETENRYLKQKPTFSVKKLLDSSFTKDFESYIQDQFFERDFWVKLKTETEVILNKHDSNGVYIGSNNWYFEKKDITNSKLLDTNISTISQFASWAEKNNISTTFLPVYSTYSIYNEYMPANSDIFDEVSAFNYMSNKLDNITVVDIYDDMISHKNEYIYFKTDHHWTQLGSFYAYHKLGQYMNFKPYDIKDFDNYYISDDFYGTLYSKAPLWNMPYDKIEIFELKNSIKPQYNVYYNDTSTQDTSLYKWDNINKKDKYTVFLGGNNSILTIKTNIDTDKKLFIIKDSFAHVLIPFLANHYSEIYVVDLRYYNESVKNYISKNGINNVLYIYNICWFADDKNIIKN